MRQYFMKLTIEVEMKNFGDDHSTINNFLLMEAPFLTIKSTPKQVASQFSDYEFVNSHLEDEKRESDFVRFHGISSHEFNHLKPHGTFGYSHQKRSKNSYDTPHFGHHGSEYQPSAHPVFKPGQIEKNLGAFNYVNQFTRAGLPNDFDEPHPFMHHGHQHIPSFNPAGMSSNFDDISHFNSHGYRHTSQHSLTGMQGASRGVRSSNNYPKVYEVEVFVDCKMTKSELISQLDALKHSIGGGCLSIIKYQFDSEDEFRLRKEQSSFDFVPVGFFNHGHIGPSKIHKQLIEELQPYFDNSTRFFQQSLNSKNYNQALRRLCTADPKHQQAITMLSILLKYKHVLEIDINEPAGEQARSAIHYAAMKKNESIYNALISAGANPDVEDKTSKSAKQYFEALPVENRIGLG